MRRTASSVAASLLLAASLALLPPAPVSGQVVTGRVLLEVAETPLVDVLVRLHFPDGREAASTVTDTAGVFRLRAPRLGPFTLSAERIGMTEVRTGELRVNAAEEVEVVLRMAERAVPLEPLTVTARSELDIGFLAGYYARVARHELVGFGHVITRDRIEERQALDVADLLREIPGTSVVQGRDRLPGIMFRGVGGECVPMVYIDGIQQNRGGAAGVAAVVDETVRPYDLEGIEVYRGVSEMPAEFFDDTRCGVILLWTRRDAEGGRPYTLRRLLMAVAGAALFGFFMMR
jgi:hypothetical protein